MPPKYCHRGRVLRGHAIRPPILRSHLFEHRACALISPDFHPASYLPGPNTVTSITLTPSPSLRYHVNKTRGRPTRPLSIPRRARVTCHPFLAPVSGPHDCTGAAHARSPATPPAAQRGGNDHEQESCTHDTPAFAQDLSRLPASPHRHLSPHRGPYLSVTSVTSSSYHARPTCHPVIVNVYLSYHTGTTVVTIPT